MSEESKKSEIDGRSASPTAPAAQGELLPPAVGEVVKGVGQRGPGRRSAEFVARLAAKYGMLPGDMLAETLMGGLRGHLEAGGAPGEYLNERAKELAKGLRLDSGEMFDRLLGVAKELMPYVHQKQPIAIDADVRSIIFQVDMGGQAQAGPGGRDLRPADVRISPMKSAGDEAGSDGAGRTPEPTPLKEND